MTYAVNSAKRSVEELSDLVNRTISQEILTVKGWPGWNGVGGVDPEIRG
jgi:multidrug efflux pump subunit AcrB